MKIDDFSFEQITTALSGYFDSLFYVEIETGHYMEFVRTRILNMAEVKSEGEDFYNLCVKTAIEYAHPEDLDYVLRVFDKPVFLKNLTDKGSSTLICRSIHDNQTVYIRCISIYCEDKKHFLFIVENIDDVVREKEEQKKILKSAQTMARRDELTGIKNKNAFVEYSQMVEEKILDLNKTIQVGIVMCDVNDLKRINDTRGHYYGDEVLQRASNMIGAVFSNSQIYRIGGDEFAVVLEGEDYLLRDKLLDKLREESIANNRSRSGPVIASGMAVYEADNDTQFCDVLKRADQYMYENKNELKNINKSSTFRLANKTEIPVPDDRKRRLDSLFGALFTMAGKGYIYLNDLQYDYSRWSLSFVDDFGMPSEYMYHAGDIWQEHIHPDDRTEYKAVIDAVISGASDTDYMRYRTRRADGKYIMVQPRSFVLHDANGNPEYFGGIVVPL